MNCERERCGSEPELNPAGRNAKLDIAFIPVRGRWDRAIRGKRRRGELVGFISEPRIDADRGGSTHVDRGVDPAHHVPLFVATLALEIRERDVALDGGAIERSTNIDSPDIPVILSTENLAVSANERPGIVAHLGSIRSTPGIGVVVVDQSQVVLGARARSVGPECPSDCPAPVMPERDAFVELVAVQIREQAANITANQPPARQPRSEDVVLEWELETPRGLN